MKIWKIPVTWEMCGIVKIKAETLTAAMEVARDKEGVLPLPTESSYVDGSWALSSDDEDITLLYQDNHILGGAE